MGWVLYLQWTFFLNGYTLEFQDKRFLQTRDIDRDAFVKGVWPLVIGVCNGYFTLFSFLQWLSCPFGISTSAGCGDIIYDARIVSCIGDGVIAGYGAAVEQDVSEIVGRLVDF